MGLPETETGDLGPEATEALAKAAKRTDALLLGPGMMDTGAAMALVKGVLALLDPVEGPAIVLDAGALCGHAALRDALRPHPGRAVLTPHAGEMANHTGHRAGRRSRTTRSSPAAGLRRCCSRWS